MAIERDELIDHLFHAILSLRSVDECYEFFEDLCTQNEIHDFSQRFHMATLLMQGYNYQEISELTGAGNATIRRVKKCVTDETSGYRIVLDRMFNE